MSNGKIINFPNVRPTSDEAKLRRYKEALDEVERCHAEWLECLKAYGNVVGLPVMVPPREFEEVLS